MDNTKEMLKPRDIWVRLNVSKNSFYNMLARGEFPAATQKYTTNQFWNRRVVDAFMEGRLKKVDGQWVEVTPKVRLAS